MNHAIWKKYDKLDKSLTVSFVILLITLVFKYIFVSYPQCTEQFYFKRVFQGVRTVYDTLLGWSPLPMFYIVVSAVLIYLLFIWWQLITGSSSFVHTLKRFTILGIILYTSFYWLWGYNYSRPTITELLSLTSDSVHTQDVITEAERMTQVLNTLREHVEGTRVESSDIEKIIRDEVVTLLDSWYIPTRGYGRMRRILPEGILLHLSTSGMYFPHALEGMIDGGLHDIQVPSTMAHEYGHVYGFGGESTCNFIALLACVQSEKSLIQYSGVLAYWRYLMSYLRASSSADYQRIYATLSEAVVNDLESIRVQMEKFPDILPQLRDLMYDTYLKSQGVKGGIANYAYVIELVHNWKKSKWNRDIYNRLYK